MTAVAEQTGNWVLNWGAEFRKLPASGFQELREAAFQRFVELGFPTTRDEEWRFTNVAPIARASFTTGGIAAADVDALAPWSAGIRLVFVNGHLVGKASGLPKGVQAGNLNEEAASYLAAHAGFSHNAFVALNTAFLNDGAFLRIARGAVIEQPIHLVYLTAP